MHFVAVHPGHIKTQALTRGVQHAVVAGSLGAKAKIIAHQQILNTQTLDQDRLNEVLWCLTC